MAIIGFISVNINHNITSADIAKERKQSKIAPFGEEHKGAIVSLWCESNRDVSRMSEAKRDLSEFPHSFS